ncbi:MAG TPA: tripartite tricarboxylate transporter substrate binding protein [Burkholderiales bacterium]|nr:tripartite tricarboxylate transporter substrate binding protein [Burkholderiales bacterium]
MQSSIHHVLTVLVLTPLLPAGEAALAAYPDKPIRMVVISAPGGTTDILSRMLAQQMGERLGQQVITDNRPGGGGIISAEITARANPDGYTLLYTHTSYSVLPSLHKKLPYDPVRDFAPVSLFAIFPGVLIVNNAVPVMSVKELIALAKSQPGKLNYASGTTGATAHLSGELLKSMAGINIVNVPYKGTGAQLAAVIGGEVQMTFASMPAALPHIRAGRVRALAVGSAKRSPALPDLPTVAETALPGFDVSAWNGILAPRGTPRAIIDRLNQELRRITRLAEVRERAAAHGAELVTSTPGEFAAYLKAQIAKWAKVVGFAGVRAD